MFDTPHYLGLVPGFNQDKPKFMATMAAVVQPFADAQQFLTDLPSEFDLDIAIGAQLDVVGQWVGQSRYIAVPLMNFWFSFGDIFRGFGKGIWKGPYDTGSGITRLDDDTYRRLLRAIIACHAWNGTLGGAIAILDDYFDDPRTLVFMQDNADMSVVIGISQVVPSLVDLMLLAHRYIPLKPVGVRTYHFVTSVSGMPLFGFGVDNPYVGGFGNGAWGVTPDQIVQSPTLVTSSSSELLTIL